jgi:hypothetical protein
MGYICVLTSRIKSILNDSDSQKIRETKEEEEKKTNSIDYLFEKTYLEEISFHHYQYL